MNVVTTLEDIKKGLACHGWMGCDKECPYGKFKGTGYDCSSELCGHALMVIEHFEGKLKQAVEDVRKLGRMGQNVCPVCAYYNHGEGSAECVKCLKEDCFRWRGEKDDHVSV